MCEYCGADGMLECDGDGLPDRSLCSYEKDGLSAYAMIWEPTTDNYMLEIGAKKDESKFPEIMESMKINYCPMCGRKLGEMDLKDETVVRILRERVDALADERAFCKKTDDSYEFFTKQMKALLRGIEAVENQSTAQEYRTPVKVGYNEYQDYYYCPTCDTRIDTGRKPHYCENCGQALDWSIGKENMLEWLPKPEEAESC